MKFKPKVKPYKHQREGLRWLWKQEKGGAFFWDPGTGKTKGAYDYVSASYLYRQVRRVLVVCPINAVQVWDDQADRHIPDPITFQVFIPEGTIAGKTDQIRAIPRGGSELTILIVNYSAIIKRDKRWDIMRALKAYAPDILILDESHHIKNATAKQSKAAHEIAGVARFRLLLTGTPIGKNNLDLYSQLKAIDPQIWKAKWTRTGVMSWTDFRNNYAIYGGRSGYEIRGYINVDDLRNRFTPYIRSARKEDILDMPKVTDSIIPVDLSPTVKRAYNIFSQEGLIVWRRHLIEAPIPLTKLLRLQQITGGWVHDEQGESVAIHMEKIAVLTDLLEDFRSTGRRVLVFARFLSEIAAIVAAADKIYPRTFEIRGGVSAESRRSIVRAFSNGSPAVLVIQSASAEALDGLQTDCAEAIFYSTDYSLIHWSQARGRLDRSGQRQPVTFYHLHVRGTVDNMVFTALKEKKNLEKMVMDDPSILISR